MTENRYVWYRNPRSLVFHAYRHGDEDAMSLCGRARLDDRAFVEVLGERVGRRCSYCPWTEEFMKASFDETFDYDTEIANDDDQLLDEIALIIDAHVSWDSRYGLDGQYDAAAEILKLFPPTT